MKIKYPNTHLQSLTPFSCLRFLLQSLTPFLRFLVFSRFLRFLPVHSKSTLNVNGFQESHAEAYGTTVIDTTFYSAHYARAARISGMSAINPSTGPMVSGKKR
jgi:hypothetical protein